MTTMNNDTYQAQFERDTAKFRAARDSYEATTRARQKKKISQLRDTRVKTPDEAGHFYQNSEGARITHGSYPISLH